MINELILVGRGWEYLWFRDALLLLVAMAYVTWKLLRDGSWL